MENKIDKVFAISLKNGRVFYTKEKDAKDFKDVISLSSQSSLCSIKATSELAVFVNTVINDNKELETAFIKSEDVSSIEDFTDYTEMQLQAMYEQQQQRSAYEKLLRSQQSGIITPQNSQVIIN